MTNYDLRAYSLASKYGFMDGDALYELDFGLRGADAHRVLAWLVRNKLLPLLPGVTVFEIITAHNPIRATDDWADFCRDSNVFVRITQADVDEAIAEIAAHSAPQTGVNDDQH